MLEQDNPPKMRKVIKTYKRECGGPGQGLPEFYQTEQWREPKMAATLVEAFLGGYYDALILKMYHQSMHI